jgi:hypothetical protein
MEGGVRYECPNMEQQQQHRPAQDCFFLAGGCLATLDLSYSLQNSFLCPPNLLLPASSSQREWVARSDTLLAICSGPWKFPFGRALPCGH